jgi:hypothetical protein
MFLPGTVDTYLWVVHDLTYVRRGTKSSLEIKTTILGNRRHCVPGWEKKAQKDLARYGTL